MRHGDTAGGSILAGGSGRASSPTERGGYWSAPSNSAPTASAPVTLTNASSAAARRKPFSLCIGALPEANPRPVTQGFPKIASGRPDPPVCARAITRTQRLCVEQSPYAHPPLARHETPFLSRNQEFARGRFIAPASALQLRATPTRCQTGQESVKQPGRMAYPRLSSATSTISKGRVYRALSQAGPGNDINAGSPGSQKAPA
jgi:hypothetical protein